MKLIIQIPCLIGSLAGLVPFDRKILEEILFRTRRSELERANPPRSAEPGERRGAV